VNRIQLLGESVEKRFGRVAALRGVDFTISPGESIAILGANGAGKSSLLRILAGLSRPSGGSFRALAEGTTSDAGPGLSRQVLRSAVGYVGHAALVYDELTARENLVFAARLHGRTFARADIDRLLDEQGLLDVAERRAGTFSRGMLQRLSIARAIAHAPGLLLLDEPFTGLDEHSADRLEERLAAQRDAGRTLLLVTHDPERATRLTERALVLHRGVVRATPVRGDAGWSGPALREALSELAREAAA
jgi:ABC-type multidrug transport system ATPase subunit